MKTILAMLLCFSFNCFADEWTKADTYREATYLTFLAIDWAQTRDQARNKWEDYHEQNPLLGSKYPSIDRVDIICMVSGIAHYYIAQAIPVKWRARFQWVSIGIEGGVVKHNFSIGMKAKF